MISQEDRTRYQQRKQELENALADPAVFGDPAKLRELHREFQRINRLADLATRYNEAEHHLTQAREMLEHETDQDLHEMAQKEVEEQEQAIVQIEDEWTLMIVPPDPMDHKGIIMEIRAGTGGDEAALFASDLYRMYSRFAERNNWNVSISSQSLNDLGGIKEIVISIEGNDVYKFLKFESGVHRVQRIPETEKQGRVHTSTATVAVLPEIEEVEFDIDPKDLKIETSTSQGAGGQSVNTTYSAIRMVHIPTGIEVRCQDERSQQQNRLKALEIMRARVFAFEEEARRNERDEERRGQIGSGERSEKIRTYNYPQSRVTDHRIHESWHNLVEIMDGDLAEIAVTLTKAQHSQAIANASKEDER